MTTLEQGEHKMSHSSRYRTGDGGDREGEEPPAILAAFWSWELHTFAPVAHSNRFFFFPSPPAATDLTRRARFSPGSRYKSSAETLAAFTAGVSRPRA